MRDLEDLLPKVLPSAPGCSEPLIIEHLREAAIKLCERTRCWRDMDTIETTGEEDEILCVPGFANLFELEWARFNDQELEARPFDVDMLFHDEGMPKYITQASPNSVSISPPAKGRLSLSMFLSPAQHADQIPAFIVERFGRALGDGALSTLLMLPDQTFTNPQLGALFGNSFKAVLDRNFAFNVRGQQRGRKRTRPNFF